MKKFILITVVLIAGIGVTLFFKFVFYNKFLFFTGLRIKAVRNEIEHETKDQDWWAGSYYYGDGFGFNKQLDISQNAGFAYESYGCLGLLDSNYGKVETENGRLKLLFVLNNEEREGLPQELFPLKWGKRSYLIPPDKMKEFHEAVERGDEPRNLMYGHFFLRIGDNQIEVDGEPSWEN